MLLFIFLSFVRSMLASFLTFLAREALIPDRRQTTLLAVSGGVDSVVLCYLFKKAGLPFSIAHCNFNLRGVEAEKATAFVKTLSESYQVPCYTTQFETKTFACNHKISLQMAARTLRYQFFNELLKKHGWNQVATAHHWDDAIETILLNFIKGTGIKGFYGIQPIHGQVIRPLLFARKKEIVAYAKEKKLAWQEDSSNRCNYYQRNFVRNKVIPLVHQLNPNFERTTRETAAKLKDIGNLFEDQLAEIKKTISSYKDGIHYVAISQILHQPWAATVAFELLRSYGFTFQQIKKLITDATGSGKIIHATNHTLYVDRQAWLIKKKSLPLAPATINLGTRLSEKRAYAEEFVGETERKNRSVLDVREDPGTGSTSKLPAEVAFCRKSTHSMTYGNHTLHFQCYNRSDYMLHKTTMTAATAALDCDRLVFPLVIRPWQAGDFFYPMGMKGRKKVSDLLIDLKIPLALKEEVLVVISNHQIVWIVGHRVDERFKLHEATKQVFEISIYSRQRLI